MVSLLKQRLKRDIIDSYKQTQENKRQGREVIKAEDNVTVRTNGYGLPKNNLKAETRLCFLTVRGGG